MAEFRAHQFREKIERSREEGGRGGTARQDTKEDEGADTKGEEEYFAARAISKETTCSR